MDETAAERCMAPELKLTNQATSDKEGAEPPMPKIAVEIIPEVEPKRSYVLSADIEARGHTGGCPGCAALASHGRATTTHNNECRERIRAIIERTLTGTARMNAYRVSVAETHRVKERKRAQVERGAGGVPMEPRSGEQMADRHAVASGEDETQNDENRTRDIHSGKRGSETTPEEEPENVRKTVQSEQEPQPHFQPCMCLFNILRVVRDKTEQGQYLCRIQVMWATTNKFLRWMYSTRWMDEGVVTSKRCWIGIEKKMPEIS